jgi:hypothetical protein
MQAAYRSGDPYLAFGKQAGAIPARAAPGAARRSVRRSVERWRGSLLRLRRLPVDDLYVALELECEHVRERREATSLQRLIEFFRRIIDSLLALAVGALLQRDDAGEKRDHYGGMQLAAPEGPGWPGSLPRRRGAVPGPGAALPTSTGWPLLARILAEMFELRSTTWRYVSVVTASASNLPALMYSIDASAK